MVSAIIELGIGYFATYQIPGILNLKGIACTIVKIIGIAFLLLGFIDFVHAVADLANGFKLNDAV